MAQLNQPYNLTSRWERNVTRQATIGAMAESSSATVTCTASAPALALEMASSWVMLMSAAWNSAALTPLGMSRDV